MACKGPVWWVEASEAKAAKGILESRGYIDKTLRVAKEGAPDGKVGFAVSATAAEGMDTEGIPGCLGTGCVNAKKAPKNDTATEAPPPPKPPVLDAPLFTPPPIHRAAPSAPPSASFYGLCEADPTPVREPAAIRAIDVANLHPEQIEGVLREVQLSAVPVVLRNLPVGDCVGKWSVGYLSEKAGDTVVHAQVCPVRKVDLAGHRLPNTPGNMSFVAMPFSELVHRASGHGDFPPIKEEGERYYLRSAPQGKAAREPSHMPDLFPTLAADFDFNALAALLCRDRYHSSALRVTSPDTELWTHYDIMHNALVQITGSKVCTLWPPSCEWCMYVEGSSCRVDDIDNPDLTTFPLFRYASASAVRCELHPGDTLFIPALWFHHTSSSSFSVAVNVFWNDPAVDSSFYHPKDIYGNKDFPLGIKAITTAEEAAKKYLRDIPQPYRAFYARRAASVLLAAAGDSFGGKCLPHPELTALVTGASGVIGRAVVSGLLKKGFKVFCTVRSEEKGRALARDFGFAFEDRVLLVDFADSASIAAIPEKLLKHTETLSVLVNNAAAAAPPKRTLTAEGHEVQFAVGALGYHRTIKAVLPFLQRYRETGMRPRIVNVASEYAGRLDLDDLLWERRKYSANTTYQSVKQADRMLSRGWSTRLANVVDVNSCHPGVVGGTSVATSLGLREGWDTAEQAAVTPIYLACDLTTGSTGGYYKDCKLVNEPKEWTDPAKCDELLRLLDSLQ